MAILNDKGNGFYCVTIPSSYLFAVDPGPTESGFVIAKLNKDKDEIVEIVDKGKIENNRLLEKIDTKYIYSVNFAIEMISSYGMPVGKEVFETCVWIGRFLSCAGIYSEEEAEHFVYRKDEKLVLCNSPRANDSNIIQALVDRYAPGQPNHGKGTKKSPGFFYGFSKDTWQAMAVAVTWLELQNGWGSRNANKEK